MEMIMESSTSNNSKQESLGLISEQQILDAQKRWGDSIVSIGSAYTQGEDYIGIARFVIDNLYAYDISKVLFKPTKAQEKQFRHSKEEAMSYFVASNGLCSEDQGFALEPWIKVRFSNENIIINSDSAVSMGNYYFTNKNNEEVKVEYTMGFILDDNGRLRINIHHSSLPFAE